MDAAVIGTGKFGYYHAEKYAYMHGVNLVGVADIDENRGHEVANKFKCNYSSDYKIFRDVDLVSIATPNATHYDIAKFFIDQGADVLIEKPMTASSFELMDLISRAKVRQVRLWGGFLEVYNDMFLTAAQELFVKEIYTHRSCEYRDCRENEDVVFDLMIHDIFLMLSMMGDEIKDLEVEKSNSLSNCNDFVRAKIEFESGNRADLTARRDVEHKTKLFCVLPKDCKWRVYNLKKKSNDTLKEELEDFASGKLFDLDLALESLQLAERIIRGGK